MISLNIMCIMNMVTSPNYLMYGSHSTELYCTPPLPLILSVGSYFARSRLCPDLVPNQTPIAAHAYYGQFLYEYPLHFSLCRST